MSNNKVKANVCDHFLLVNAGVFFLLLGNQPASCHCVPYCIVGLHTHTYSR